MEPGNRSRGGTAIIRTVVTGTDMFIVGSRTVPGNAFRSRLSWRSYHADALPVASAPLALALLMSIPFAAQFNMINMAISAWRLRALILQVVFHPVLTMDMLDVNNQLLSSARREHANKVALFGNGRVQDLGCKVAFEQSSVFPPGRLESRSREDTPRLKELLATGAFLVKQA